MISPALGHAIAPSAGQPADNAFRTLFSWRGSGPVSTRDLGSARILVQTKPAIMRRATLAVVAGAVLGLAAWVAQDPVRDFLVQDRCLDAGGRWIAVDRRCDLGDRMPL
jgi:hypothetical protein